MALLKWSNFFSVGIDEIDAQHKQLITMLNNLHYGIVNKEGDKTIKNLLPKLLAYTKQHFTDEERFMMEIGFPGFPEHHKKHYEMAEQVSQLCDDVENGAEINQLEMITFLTDWLKEHIMDEDMQYGRYAVTKEAHIL